MAPQLALSLSFAVVGQFMGVGEADSQSQGSYMSRMTSVRGDDDDLFGEGSLRTPSMQSQGHAAGMRPPSMHG